MKTNGKISAYIGASTVALLFSCLIVVLCSAINLPEQSAKPVAPQNNAPAGAIGQESAASAVRKNPSMSFADRVAYQRAIEEVYWRHRTWPKTRPEPKPSLDSVMSQATIEQKVQDYLRKSELLEQEWQKPARNASHNDAGGPITPAQLQAEMERMAQHSKQPELLRELFAALDNDPFVIAECLARPVLSERLVTIFYAHDRELLNSGRSGTENERPKLMAAASANYTLPTIVTGPHGCIGDTWTTSSITNAPSARIFHTAVWTGSEMIVWGGHGDGAELNTGGRYSPATDSWTLISTNAPSARIDHTGVWTGSEMIVWGGSGGPNYFNTGGRYNPTTDTWQPTSTTGAPEARWDHTATWTGNEMIVWGGHDFSGASFTGGRYNPSMDTWTATSTTNAPTARQAHTAVWTGCEMIVWGGIGNNSTFLNTGGRYNPLTDSWTAISTNNAPSGRDSHGAVWTNSGMIVWGGYFYDGISHYLDTGGTYDPGTDSWTPTTIINAPFARYFHTAVWSGNEMVIWGGIDGISDLDTGGRYDPSTDNWIATTTADAPAGRAQHTAVWSGSEMIVWGGFRNSMYLNTGGRYCAQSGSPTITLDAKKRNREEINTVRLRWSGATSTDLDVYRDGALIATTPNDGSYLDSTGDTGRARYTYQVCEAGTQVCSNEDTVSFAH